MTVPDGELSLICVKGAAHENTEAKAMGRAGYPTNGQAGPPGSWRVEDSRRFGPPCGIGEANGPAGGSAGEEVAVERLVGALCLQSEAAANLPHKPERGLSIATIEERSIKLREDAHSK